MKIMNLTKLALSGVALAAVATTLGTSTYAWYVTNSTSYVKTMSSGTATSSNSSIFVAADSSGTAAGFTSSLQFSDANVNNSTKNSLTPVHSTDATSFYALAEAASGSVDVGTTNQGSMFVEYDFWVMTTSTKTVNFAYTVSNTTTSFTTQKSYNATGSGEAYGTNFYVDAVKAMRVATFTEAAASSTAASVASTTLASATLNGIYDMSAMGSFSAAAGASSNATNAHNYYEAVTKNTLSAAAKSDVTTLAGTQTNFSATAAGLQSINCIAEIPVRVTFRFWLEGASLFCFDSCGGQTFNIDITLTMAS